MEDHPSELVYTVYIYIYIGIIYYHYALVLHCYYYVLYYIYILPYCYSLKFALPVQECVTNHNISISRESISLEG